jgi:YHS domain-containing protein
MGMLDRMKGDEPKTATDPVCKMKVDTAKAPGGKSEHGGQWYYFCSAGCKRAFDADPHKYLGAHHHGDSRHMGAH